MKFRLPRGWAIHFTWTWWTDYYKPRWFLDGAWYRHSPGLGAWLRVCGFFVQVWKP